MKKSTLLIFIFVITTICHGQTTHTKYFNNEWLEKEVKEEKAKFSQTVTNNADGTVTTEIRNLKKNEIIRSETYKGDEPFGLWVYQTCKSTSNLDYNFPLKYFDEKCKDSIPSVKIKNYFQDNDSLSYIAPKTSTGETIYQFIAHNLNFPTRAKEEGIQGKVYVRFTLTQEGSLENIFIKKGANILLDKEAVRVLRQLKFSNPPTLEGKTYRICMTLPISFILK